MAKALRQTPSKVYVRVETSFDRTGYMNPKAIVWDDGRIFTIDSIRDFRPATTVGLNLHGDCYTVMIKGQERHLFFERTDPIFTNRVGRWFVTL